MSRDFGRRRFAVTLPPRIALSTLITNSIGETEKNLRRLFDPASRPPRAVIPLALNVLVKGAKRGPPPLRVVFKRRISPPSPRITPRGI